MAEETIQNEPVQSDPGQPDDLAPTMADGEDEFDRLRRKSTLASSVYDDMEMEEDDGGESTNPLSRLTTAQMIILFILLVIDVVAIGALIYWVVSG